MEEYKISTVFTESLGEIDFELYESLFGKDRTDKIYETNKHPTDYILDRRSDFSEGYPLKIEVLEKIISEMKKKGADYIAIDYHCDHIGYEIEGLKMEKL